MCGDVAEQAAGSSSGLLLLLAVCNTVRVGSPHGGRQTRPDQCVLTGVACDGVRWGAINYRVGAGGRAEWAVGDDGRKACTRDISGARGRQTPE